MCFVPGTEQSVGCNGGDVAHILAVIHLHQTIIMSVAFLFFFLPFFIFLELSVVIMVNCGSNISCNSPPPDHNYVCCFFFCPFLG